MSFLADLASGGLATIASSALGMIGAYATKHIELKREKLRIDADIELSKHAIEQLKIETVSAEKRAEMALNERKFLADAEALKESIRADKASYTPSVAEYVTKANLSPKLSSVLLFMMGIVDFCRGMARLVLTGLATWVIFMCGIQLQHIGFTTENANLALITILQVSNTIICWWFGSRGTPENKAIKNR